MANIFSKAGSAIGGAIKSVASKIKETAGKIGPAIQQGGSYGTSITVGGKDYTPSGPAVTTTGGSGGGGGGSGGGGSGAVVTPVNTGRGGGGSYQGPVQPGTSEETFRSTGQSLLTTTQINQQVARDTGVVQNTNVVSTYKPSTLSDIPGYVSANIKKDFVGTITGAGKIAFGAAAGFSVAAWNKLSDKEKRDALQKQEEIKLMGGERERSFVQSGRGTIVKENIPYTNEEIVKLAESGNVSEGAALNELGRREGEKYGNEANFIIRSSTSQLEQEGKDLYSKYYNQVKTDVSNKQQDLQQQVQSGKISADQANKELSKYVENKNKYLQQRAEEINNYTNTELKNRYQKWLETRGAKLEKDSNVYLDKVSDKVKLSKTMAILPLIVAGGFATGGALTAIAGTSATAGAVITGVGTAGAVVGGGMTGVSFYKSYKEGTLTATKVAATLLPMVAFGAGAYAGSRFAAPRVDSVKLNSALERADVVIKRNPKGITKETDIAALKISDGEKAQLLAQLRAGNSLREVNYRIEAGNSADRAIIKKGIPRQNIKVYEVVNSAGQVAGEVQIQSLGVGKVKVGRGLVSSKEDFLSVGKGKMDAKTGKVTMDTLQVGVKGKDIVSAQRFRTTSKGQIKTIKTDADDVFRIQTSRGFTQAGDKIITSEPVQQPITARDIMQVIKSRPSQVISTTKAGEVQELILTKALKIQKITDTGDDILLALEKTFKTKAGGGITTKYVKPIEYTKVPSYSKIKGFDVKTETIKAVEQPTITSNAVQKVIKQSQKNTNLNIPVGDYSSQILSSAQRGASSLNVQTTPVVLLVTKTRTIQIDKTLQDISPVQIYAQKLNSRFKILSKTGITPASSSALRPMQTPRVAQAVVPKITTKQIQELIQPPTSTFKPFTPYVPNINIPKFPLPKLPSFQTGGGYSKLKKNIKRQQQRESKYAASLAAAAFQIKPVKVTKEQYKALGKRESYGELRPVVQIVSEDELKKKLKTAVKF